MSNNDDWLPFAPLDPQEHVEPEKKPRNPNRTPMILGAVAGVMLIAAIVVVSVYLLRVTAPTTAGPAASESAEADPAPQPSTPQQQPQPSATPTEEAPSTAIALNGSGFTLTTADGEFTHRWADDPAPAIEALTEAFGTAPEEDFVNGDAENWAYDIYVWKGFRFYDVFLGDGGRSRSEVPAPTYVAVTAGLPADVRVTNEFGITVGQSLDDARAKNPVDEVALTNGRVRLAFGDGRGTFYNDGNRVFSAFVESDESAQEVASVTYVFRARGQ
ncbi:hypothetical protein KZX37_03400 [Microbacterium sp. EYE_5]|uniref:hypothetical protein n=1 Tax=unclassified Microbacterium TaxID=2609290 RepID=UPI0020059994|nr:MULTISPECIES: hypothetical protein [unclassified Microbacterium]MCK6079665.1 hypothetical protein [Microbacterium sp. EYE_382]MCK6084936.1 hypothetical protein [Microbacterium sp. EYE_384]MCK6122838.1 hypothetical protein [Microbacterium sp. EYE_80]MCK6125699.1 hypothetical protein [Microbacterium sp. EYE_79]MCK6140620.1 hypothetical protein [Microbacterium sp. EYE_39]